MLRLAEAPFEHVDSRASAYAIAALPDRVINDALLAHADQSFWDAYHHVRTTTIAALHRSITEKP